MRALIGWVLHKMFVRHENKAINKRIKNEFKTFEEMGTYSRYGMSIEKYEEFFDFVSDRAGQRYAHYIDFIHFFFMIDHGINERLWRWYFYTEFYYQLLKRKIKY